MRLLLVACLVVLAGPAAAQSGFDGLWQVDVDVTRGDCPERASFPVRIRAGHIVYAGNLDVDAFGTVTADGQVSASVRRGRDHLTASGRLGARVGRGRWHAPTRACAGVWRARRL